MSGRTRLVLVRHGRTSYNVQGRLQGRLDIDLDEVGRRQVAATAPVIAAMEPAAVLSSPLQRARHTAEAIASAAGVSVREDGRLVEIDVGVWSGEKASQLRRNDPTYAAGMTARDDYVRPGGESAGEVAERIIAVCADAVGEHAGQTVVLVSHGFALRTAAAYLMGGDYAASRQFGGLANCGWIVLDHLDAEERQRRGFTSPWRLIAYNATVS